MNLGKDNKLALFEGQKIRKVFHDGDWWFAVEDVVLALIIFNRTGYFSFLEAGRL